MGPLLNLRHIIRRPCFGRHGRHGRHVIHLVWDASAFIALVGGSIDNYEYIGQYERGFCADDSAYRRRKRTDRTFGSSLSSKRFPWVTGTTVYKDGFLARRMRTSSISEMTRHDGSPLHTMKIPMFRQIDKLTPATIHPRRTPRAPFFIAPQFTLPPNKSRCCPLQHCPTNFEPSLSSCCRLLPAIRTYSLLAQSVCWRRRLARTELLD